LTTDKNNVFEMHTDVHSKHFTRNNRPWHTVILNQVDGYALEIDVNAGEAEVVLRTPYSNIRVALSEKEAHILATQLRKEFMEAVYVKRTSSSGKLIIPGRVSTYQSRKTVMQRNNSLEKSPKKHT